MVMTGDLTDRSLRIGAAVEPTAPTPVALRGPPSFLRGRILALSPASRSARPMRPDRASRNSNRPAGAGPLPRCRASSGAAPAIPAGALRRPEDISVVPAADGHPLHSGHPARGDWPSTVSSQRPRPIYSSGVHLAAGMSLILRMAAPPTPCAIPAGRRVRQYQVRKVDLKPGPRPDRPGVPKRLPGRSGWAVGQAAARTAEGRSNATSASTSRSIIASVCSGVGVKRSRSSPRGTVG